MSQLRPNASTWTWNHGDAMAGQIDQLHGLNRKLGLHVLDCFGGAVKWNRRQDWYDGAGLPWRFPKDLAQAADGFAAVAARWGDTEGGIEADNEVDSKAYTPDQYSVLLKTMRWGLHQTKSRNATAVVPPLVCGAFTDAVHTSYLDSLGRNQAMTVCDAVSYHTYTDPVRVQDDLARVRLWQAKYLLRQTFLLTLSPFPIHRLILWSRYNGSHLPLMITESGADFSLRWNSSGARPSLDQGRAYAFDNTAHQIENIACGVDRTFMFSKCSRRSLRVFFRILKQRLHRLRVLPREWA